MARKELPAPSISISNTDARRFMLSHHCLWPPRNLGGKTGILDYIRLVGSIQFDPINVVGRNPDLVLQSRVKNYRWLLFILPRIVLTLIGIELG
jgi:uncharacterized protein YcaQ